jgi:hypothetical protein
VACGTQPAPSILNQASPACAHTLSLALTSIHACTHPCAHTHTYIHRQRSRRATFWNKNYTTPKGTSKPASSGRANFNCRRDFVCLYLFARIVNARSNTHPYTPTHLAARFNGPGDAKNARHQQFNSSARARGKTRSCQES